LSRYADHVIAVSSPVKRRAEYLFGVKSSRISVIPNGCIPGQADGRERLTIRQKLSLEPQHVVLLFVGRSRDPVKGAGLLSSCVAKIHQRFPDVRMMSVPGDGLGDTQWLVRTGAVLHRDMADYYAAADIFVNASLSEGLPLTVVEAMGAGLPVVAAAVGGIPELIKHEETGLLLKRDRSDLAEQLIRLIQDPKLRKKLGQSAKQAAGLLSWRQIAGRTLAVYDSGLRGNQRR